MSGGRIVRVFLDVNLAQGHDGLRDEAKRGKVTTDKLEPGEYVVFVNRAQDRVKIYTGNGVLAYLRSKGQRIDLSVISKIPAAFKNNGKLDYDSELAKILKEKLPVSS